MHSPIETPSQKQAARRRLVRGVFAAPAIMTVCSGSAFAAGSSLRCLQSQCANPSVQPVANALDGWLRVQLWQTGTTTPSYFVCGADLQIYKRTSNTVYLGTTQWQPFNIATNVSGANCAAPSGAVRCAKYATVRFDAAGNVVGVGSGTGSAVAGTCWSSFAPDL